MTKLEARELLLCYKELNHLCPQVLLLPCSYLNIRSSFHLLKCKPVNSE